MGLYGLKKFEKIYPLFIEKFEDFTPAPDNADITVKINSLISYLNSVGRLTNDVVSDWNNVMTWSMNEGLKEATEDKIDDLISSGKLPELVEPFVNEITTLAEEQILLIETNQVATKDEINEVTTKLATTNQQINDVTKTIGIGNFTTFFNTDRYKGANLYIPYNISERGDYQTILNKVVEVGCNTIAFNPILEMATSTSNTLTRKATDTEVVNMFSYAKSIGLKIMLKCHVNVSGGGSKNPANQIDWLSSYSQHILYYMNLLKDYVDIVCLANELDLITKTNKSLWQKLNNDIKEIKNVITTEAPTVWELNSTVLHEIVDVIGCNMYIAVGGNSKSSVDDLKAKMFNDIRNFNWISTLNGYAKRYRKPVFVTEVGILPIEYSLNDPGKWDYTTAELANINEYIQTLYYETAIGTYLNSSNIRGIFIWSVGDGFTFIGRQAEQTVKELFGGV